MVFRLHLQPRFLIMTRSEGYDQGDYNDEVFLGQYFIYEYDLPSNSWSCINEEPNFPVGEVTTHDFTDIVNPTSQGTASLKMGVFVE